MCKRRRPDPEEKNIINYSAAKCTPPGPILLQIM
jgi:hypothetical protein